MHEYQSPVVPILREYSHYRDDAPLDSIHMRRASIHEHLYNTPSIQPHRPLSMPNTSPTIMSTIHYGKVFDYPVKRKSFDSHIPIRTCEFCGTKDSPEWRKGPSGSKSYVFFF